MAALKMYYYRYINLCLISSFFLSQLWQVTVQESNSPSKKEKLKDIPQIPELSSNIRDPSRWKNGTRLIFFYSPWCEHSIAMKPLLYDVIEEIYYKNISGIWVGQMDVSVNSDVARAFRIKATPTLLLFNNGSRYDFDDDVTVSKIVQFIVKVISPSMTEVHNYRQLKELLIVHPVLFFLVYDDEIDRDWETIFTQVSVERTLIADFAFTVNTTIPQELGLTLPSLPKLMVLKDKQAYLYTDTSTKYKMTLWVESEQFPALPFTNRTTFRPIVSIGNSKRLAVLLLSSITNIPLNQKKAVEIVRRVAESRKLISGYQFVVLDDQELAYQMTGVYLTTPSLFVWEKKTGYYYLYDSSSGFTEKTISSLLFSITSGKMKESGGPSMRNTVTHYYWLIYNLVQSMMSYRPMLTVFAVVCLGAGLSVCIYSRRRSKKKREFQKRLKVTRAIRQRKRQENEERQVNEEREQKLRRRGTAHSDNEGSAGSDEGSAGSEDITGNEEELEKDKDK